MQDSCHKNVVNFIGTSSMLLNVLWPCIMQACVFFLAINIY